MEYKFRELTARDIFPMCKLISKFGISEFKKCFDPNTISAIVTKLDTKNGDENGDENGNENNDEVLTAVGVNIVFDIVGIITEKLPECENEIFEFLASVSDKTVKELKAMKMSDFARMIIDFVKKDDFKDFFEAVSESLN